jgi:hypothetical protein
MPRPSPEKLARLLKATQKRWEQPERHLVDCSEIAMLKGMWDITRENLINLDSDMREVDRLMVRVEADLPVGRDIVFWVNDPTAKVPFSLYADELDRTEEALREELFRGISKPVLRLLANVEPLRCPLCQRRK